MFVWPLLKHIGRRGLNLYYNSFAAVAMMLRLLPRSHWRPTRRPRRPTQQKKRLSAWIVPPLARPPLPHSFPPARSWARLQARSQAVPRRRSRDSAPFSALAAGLAMHPLCRSPQLGQRSAPNAVAVSRSQTSSPPQRVPRLSGGVGPQPRSLLFPCAAGSARPVAVSRP